MRRVRQVGSFRTASLTWRTAILSTSSPRPPRTRPSPQQLRRPPKHRIRPATHQFIQTLQRLQMHQTPQLRNLCNQPFLHLRASRPQQTNLHPNRRILIRIAQKFRKLIPQFFIGIFRERLLQRWVSMPCRLHSAECNASTLPFAVRHDLSGPEITSMVYGFRDQVDSFRMPRKPGVIRFHSPRNGKHRPTTHTQGRYRWRGSRDYGCRFAGVRTPLSESPTIRPERSFWTDKSLRGHQLFCALITS